MTLKTFILLALCVAVSADEYDYIVVGAGTSGAVLAARLSDDSHANVLVLDRGTDDSAFSSTYVNFFDTIAIANPISWALGKNPLIKHHFSTETTMGFASQ